jgi:hypothetical protein
MMRKSRVKFLMIGRSAGELLGGSGEAGVWRDFLF